MNLRRFDFEFIRTIFVRSVLSVSFLLLLSVGILRAQELDFGQTATTVNANISSASCPLAALDIPAGTNDETIQLANVLAKSYLSPNFCDTSLNRVVQDFRMWQSFYLPFVSSNTNFIYSPRSATVRAFDPTGFPPGLVARLVPEKYQDIGIVYRLSVYQDSRTLETVFLNGNAEEIWREPTTVKKDPWFWLRWRHPWALEQNTETAQTLRNLYDPARIRIDYLLLPLADVPDFALARAHAIVSRRSELKSRGANTLTRTMNLFVPAANDFVVTALFATNDTVDMEIHLPDGTNCQVDVLYTTSLPGFPWSLMTTTPTTSGTFYVQFACSLSNAFFRAGNADIDTDGDGIPDDREIFMYGTDPTKWDTDGDGISDFDEIFAYGTDPNNPDTTPPIITILTPVDGEWKAVLP